MLEIRQLEFWHLQMLVNQGAFSDNYGKDNMQALCSAGPAIAVFKDGVLVGAGGLVIMWENVAEGWSIITTQLKKSPVSLARVFKKFMRKYCDSFNRIQITVLDGFERGAAFAEYLGFIKEGVMEKYSPSGETHIRYARIK